MGCEGVRQSGEWQRVADNRDRTSAPSRQLFLCKTQETNMLITMLIGVTVALAALTVAADPN